MVEIYSICDGVILTSLSNFDSLLVSKHVGNYPKIIEEENNKYAYI